MTHIRFGLFPTKEAAERAVEALSARSTCRDAVKFKSFNDRISLVNGTSLRASDWRRGFSLGSSLGAVSGALLFVALVVLGLFALDLLAAAVAGAVAGAIVGGLSAGLYASGLPSARLSRAFATWRTGNVAVVAETAREDVAREVKRGFAAHGAIVS